MIEALRNDDIIEKLGGRFKLASLIQQRWLELIQGARPMVDPKGLTDMEVVLREIEGLETSEVARGAGKKIGSSGSHGKRHGRPSP